MKEGESSTTDAPVLFSTAASPSESLLTITTAAIHAPSTSSMQDYRSTRHISLPLVIIKFDIPIPPEFCKYEPQSINHTPSHYNHGNLHCSTGRPPDNSQLHRKPYYFLQSSQHITDNSIFIGQATMVGSRWGGYSKSRLRSSKDHIG
jgi:hypothetical protein